MKYFEKIPAVLLLEDGTAFHGQSAGKIGTATGEICFNTGMTGYQEVFTDPSYYGQLLVMTNVHIGNYGIREEETESGSVKIAGLVCRNFTNLFSRSLATASIQEYLLAQNIIAISDIDTRALVRHIRSKGAMNAVISSEHTDIARLKQVLAGVPPMAGLELASKVTTPMPYFFGNSSDPCRVAVMDYGVKRNILRSLAGRGCYLKVFPASTVFDEVDKWKPDGIFISNGPGDPASMPAAVDLIREALKIDIPLFGICLGHQLLALANGIKTYKMHHGHRGINHPVLNLETRKGEITTQNHGFGVAAEDIARNKHVEVTHLNLNDGTIEGIRVLNKRAFSVQYHPEAWPGPHDSEYLFDRFVAMMGGKAGAASKPRVLSGSAKQ